MQCTSSKEGPALSSFEAALVGSKSHWPFVSPSVRTRVLFRMHGAMAVGKSSRLPVGRLNRQTDNERNL